MTDPRRRRRHERRAGRDRRPDATVDHVHHREVLPVVARARASSSSTRPRWRRRRSRSPGARSTRAGPSTRSASPTSARRRSCGTGRRASPSARASAGRTCAPSACASCCRRDGIRVAPNVSATKLAFLLDMADPDRTATCASARSTRWIAWTFRAAAPRDRRDQRRVTGLLHVDGSRLGRPHCSTR